MNLAKSAADLLLNYINPAINLAQSLKLNPDANAFMSLAKFSDAQFTTLNSYLTSSEFATRQNFLTQAQKDVVVLSDLGEKSRLLRLLQRQSALEIDELTALTTDADHFLEASIDAYAQCLTLSDDHNLSIFRFISLWLSSINSKFQNRASKINKIMSERLPSIRADKFLPLVPQLAVRLSSKCDADSSFQNILMKGRLLPTPEMVPFRLTRDLVHALGPLGLQTGFIPAAEAVLRELRNGSDVILTLLQ
ncbi:uncharacterized protein DC041_0005125, partial [Schistosoma bovis]